jgi:hypothetical protein
MTNQETYRHCHCGKKISPPRNSTIWAKECPACQFAAVYDKKKAGKSKDSFFTGKPTVDKPKKGGIDKQLDDAWSLLVKLRAGMKCEYCKSMKSLNSHHLNSRAKKTVRWIAENGICLCVNHHIGNEFSTHKTSIPFTIWLIKYKGQKFMDDLQWKSNQTGKYTEFEKKILLNELLSQIKSLT